MKDFFIPVRAIVNNICFLDLNALFGSRDGIKIYEGEDTEDISNDFYYDEYEHSGIEQNRAGIPKIEVTFDFDKNRVLHVSSVDLKTGTKGNKDVKVR